MKRILIIGGTGLVGSKLSEFSREYGFESFSTYNARPLDSGNSVRLDVTDRTATIELARKVRPDVIVDTHALHNVDYCETHREEARRVNVDGTRNLVDAARGAGSRLLYVSTDYVFDGTRGGYREDDPTTPLSYYAENKVEAENIVSTLPSFIIARPSVIYGWNAMEKSATPSSSGKTVNFAMFVLDKFARHETVRAVNDQYSSPTFADNLALALLKLAGMDVNGVFHVAGRSCLSRFDFAVKAANIFDYSPDLVQKVSSSDFKQVAKRPMNSCLSIEKAERMLKMRFMSVEDGLAEMKNQVVVASKTV